MKVLGFVSGAVVAVIGVTAFNAWRHVSDNDLLVSALRDHCIPYVETGAMPFGGIGRAPGVYDNVEIDDRLTNRGTKIVFDARFVATWGEIEDLSLRVCRVDGRPTGASLQGFAVDPDGLDERLNDAVQELGDLRPDTERLGEVDDIQRTYRTLGWFEAGKAQDRGNRVVLSVTQSQVTNVIVVRDRAR